jgi:HD superfamily phosphohydrolase
VSFNIKDPIHKQIIFEKQFEKIVRSSYFKRCKYITQTSFSNSVYPSSNNTRYSHMIGTYYLMKKFVNNGLNDLTKIEKENLIKLALLHDIGHGPFAHIFEKIFPTFSHETETKKIIKNKFKFNEIEKIFNKNHELYLFISSTIDIDKMDYLLRDSYSCGLFGMPDINFILTNTYIKNKKLIIKEKAITSVEDLIYKRINLFKILYFHKNSILKDFIFRKIFEIVQKLVDENKINELEINKDLLSFFQKKNTTQNLLNLVEFDILSNLKIWTNSKNKELNFFSNLFFENDFFTIKKINNLKKEKKEIQILKNKIKKKYDLKNNFLIIEKEIKTIENQIWVEVKNKKLEKIENHSNLIKFYKFNKPVLNFIIYPREFEF